MRQQSESLARVVMRNATCRYSAVQTHICNHTSHELSENGTSSHPNWLTAAVWIRSAPDLLDTFTTEISALPLGLTEQCSFAELTTGNGTGTILGLEYNNMSAYLSDSLSVCLSICSLISVCTSTHYSQAIHSTHKQVICSIHKLFVPFASYSFYSQSIRFIQSYSFHSQAIHSTHKLFVLLTSYSFHSQAIRSFLKLFILFTIYFIPFTIYSF